MVDDNPPSWLDEGDIKTVDADADITINQLQEDDIKGNKSVISMTSMPIDEKVLGQTSSNKILFMRFANMGVSIALVTEAVGKFVVSFLFSMFLVPRTELL